MSPPVPVPSVQQLLGSAGEPAAIVHAGKTYRLGHPDQRAKARLEQLVARQARENLLAAGVPEVEWVRQATAGEFRTLRAGWSAVLSGENAAVLTLLAQLQEHHPDLTADDVRDLIAAEPGQVNVAVMETTPDFLRVLLANLPADQREQKIRHAVAAMEAALPAA